MALALLLSPDDQAVSAVTAVLEEMSVSCERPLDGVVAAKQLNSHNFDLVIVDCENLPAAKLIFDVCRRGIGGKNPVPIAIVNGRAGLPTAFRLGADLILTKPVAKDQARSTIRGAVNRVKKEQPGSGQAPEQLEAIPAETSNAGLDSLGAQAGYDVASASSGQVPSDPKALAAAASSHGQPLHGASTTASAAVGTAPTVNAAASAVSAPDLTSAAIGKAAAKGSMGATTHRISDDPVLAELERAEAGPEAGTSAPVFSAYLANESKKHRMRGPLVALVALALVASGFYAAWITQPGFRTLVEPQVEQVLSLVGMAPFKQTPAPVPVRVKPTPPPAPVAGSPAGPASSTEPGATDSTGNSTAPTAAADAPAPHAVQSSPASSAAVQTPGTTPSATNGTAASPAAGSHNNKIEGDKTTAALNSGGSASADKNAEPGVSGDGAVVLSSSGAEKRLIHSVPPSYPAAARSSGAEGPVILKAMINESGKVSSVQVVQGNAVLAESAVNAVKQWRYRPYTRDGKVVPFQTIVQVDFPRP